MLLYVVTDLMVDSYEVTFWEHLVT